MAHGKYQQAWQAPERPVVSRGGRQQHYRRRSFRYIRFVALAAIIIGTLYAIFFSSLFVIRGVAVEGNSAVAANDILRIEQDKEGQRRFLVFSESNILFFNTREFRNELIAQLPRIATVDIKRRFPPTLSVHIIERSTAALWQNKDQYYKLSSSGQILDQSAVPKSDDVVITDSSRIDPTIIGDIMISETDLRVVTNIAVALKSSSEIAPTSYDIKELQEFTIRAKTKPGWDILFSTHLDTKTQLDKLQVFMAEKTAQNKDWQKSLTYIDLRFGSTRVYYK